MLSIEKVRSTEELDESLENLNPQNQSWIVPDLKTKLEVQKIFLKKYGVLEEDAVLRASELWQKILKSI